MASNSNTQVGGFCHFFVFTGDTDGVTKPFDAGGKRREGHLRGIGRLGVE